MKAKKRPIGFVLVGCLSVTLVAGPAAAQQPESGSGKGASKGMSQQQGHSQGGQESHGVERKQPDTPPQAGSPGQQGMKSPGTPMEKDAHGGDKLIDDREKAKKH